MSPTITFASSRSGEEHGERGFELRREAASCIHGRQRRRERAIGIDDFFRDQPEPEIGIDDTDHARDRRIDMRCARLRCDVFLELAQIADEMPRARQPLVPASRRVPARRDRVGAHDLDQLAAMHRVLVDAAQMADGEGFRGADLEDRIRR